MNCPVCADKMEKGVIMVRGRMEYSYWAPDKYFEKHPYNPSYRLQSSIEKEGGVILDFGNNTWNGSVFDDPPAGWRCPECGLLVMDMNHKYDESDKK